MSDLYFRETIHQLLKALPSQKLTALKNLFWTELNYDRENQVLSTREWQPDTAALLRQPPLLFASAGSDTGFHILYCQLNNSRMLLGTERLVISLLEKDHPHALYIFANDDETQWHFVNVRRLNSRSANGTNRSVLRRITVSPDERLRTATERIAMLDVSQVSPDLFSVSPLALQSRHDEAFDVEKVTRDFFNEYRSVFNRLQDALKKQNDDPAWAHDYALQFLNRVMFLYFVQRKRWLNNDIDFLNSYWQVYKTQNAPDRTFVRDWLNVLFFEAFNKQYSNPSYFPQPIHDILHMTPYLNGGLFTCNDLDTQYTVKISDDDFYPILSFFQKYNFTISEDTPLDQEVAVDPEMIGKVYESLVNVADSIDEQSEAGIFYTPRVEIDLMVRLSLADWLCNQFGGEHRNLFLDLLFALDAPDRAAADQAVSDQNLWRALYEKLQSLTLLDPACGSGSFLVGALYVLDDLIARAQDVLGLQVSAYERKKSIIGSSLYGVDVKAWAIAVGELRLWLQLVIDSDLRPEELQLQPLLPNLTFKLRCGDSMVQEIGGVNLALRHGGQITPAMKGRITNFTGQKLKFYYNDPACKYKTDKEVRQAERLLFEEWLADRETTLQRLIMEKEELLQPTTNLFGQVQSTQMTTENAAKQLEQEKQRAELDQVRRARKLLAREQQPPFVWDIAFVEIFEGESAGFDLIIGNPPYVRQEEIRDPKLRPEQVTPASKRAYKDSLSRAVYSRWPNTFGYKPQTDTASWKLDAKSDLYIYFYFYTLGLLNPRGTFCFITSNSWLDVGYGSDLQQFLLTRGAVRLVLDNEVKRSFESADVNTVIVLLTRPQDLHGSPAAREHTARFVMAQAPFEQLLNAADWRAVFSTAVRTVTTHYRVLPKTQREMLAAGMNNEGKYASDKWGGKYLRAPDIYWHILEKYGDKFVRLGDVAEVRRGITTGANEFFYLDAEAITRWGIEEEFLVPVIKSPRECKRLIINPEILTQHLFVCGYRKEKIKNTNAYRYIQWGETLGFHNRPSTKNRSRWYDIGERRIAPIISPSSFSVLPRFFINNKVLCDKRLYEIYPQTALDTAKLHLIINSSFSSLFLETGSRTGLGEGLLDITVYELANMLIIEPWSCNSPYTLLEIDHEVQNVPNEFTHPSRKLIDEYSFEYLGLSRMEIDDFYAALEKLVSNRLSRASSLD